MGWIRQAALVICVRRRGFWQTSSDGFAVQRLSIDCRPHLVPLTAGHAVDAGAPVRGLGLCRQIWGARWHTYIYIYIYMRAIFVPRGKKNEKGNVCFPKCLALQQFASGGFFFILARMY